jgi:hypothetical protein
MVVLFVALTFLFFMLLDLITSRIEAWEKAQNARFVPGLGLVMADGGKPIEKK